MNMSEETMWIPVSSSAIDAFAYDAAHHRLRVRWNGDRTYEYDGVDEQCMRDFLAAPSKGRFLAQHIRAEFPYRSLDFRPPLHARKPA